MTRSPPDPRLVAALPLLLGAGCVQPVARSAATDAPPASLVALFAAFTAAALTLALLHLLFYAFERRERIDLYFALMAVSFAAVAYFDFRQRVGENVFIPTLGDAQRLAVSLLILTSARFVFALFEPRAPRRFWLYAAAIAAVLLAGAVDDRLFDLPAGLLGLVVIGDLLVVLARSWRRLEEGAWLLALGMAGFAAGGGVQLALDLLGRGALADRLAAYLWGGLVMLLAISVYLARSFVATHRELERRLAEVETLSRQRLEQEQAAREEEVRRRLLEADNRRKTAELEEARRLQLALLPAEIPRVAGLEIAAAMRTATEVGGDFYDFRPEPGGAVTVVIADAVGHGARAGTLVAAVKALVQGMADGEEPAARLAGFSSALRGMGLPRAHVAMALARFGADGVEVATAGMPPPLLLRRGASEPEELGEGGLPLGGGPAGLPYRSVHAPLEPGDLVLLASDGLPELPGDDGGPLGYPATRRLFAEAAGGSARDVLDGLLAAVAARTGGAAPPDDVTLVVVRRVG